MEMKRKTYAQPWLQVVRLQVHNQLLADSDVESSTSIDGWGSGTGDSQDFEI